MIIQKASSLINLMKLDPIIFIYSTSISPTLKKLAKNCHWLMHSIQLRSIFANTQRLGTNRDLPVLLLCIKWYSIHGCMHRPKAIAIYQDQQKYFIPNKPDQSRRWITIDNFFQANIKSSIQLKNTFPILRYCNSINSNWKRPFFESGPFLDFHQYLSPLGLFVPLRDALPEMDT